MGRHSLDAVMATVDNLIAGAFDDARLPDAMEDVRRLFDGSKACISQISPALEESAIYATNVDETLQARCFGDLADDFISLGMMLRSIPVGTVYRDHERLGEGFRESRVWQEWMRPQDMYGGLGSRLIEFGDSYWLFDVQRGRKQAPFDSDDIALLDRLAPILCRVAAISRQVGRLRLERDEAREVLDRLSLGIVLVDAELRLSYANMAGEQIVAAEDSALPACQGRLQARDAVAQKKLKAGVESAIRLAHDPLAAHRSNLILPDGHDGQHCLAVCVLPATKACPAGMDGTGKAMITLRALRHSDDLAGCAREIFDLTEAEARLASALSNGLSIAEAAACQTIRISTARTHLARIFQKTNTRQQSQLVSLLRNAAFPLR